MTFIDVHLQQGPGTYGQRRAEARKSAEKSNTMSGGYVCKDFFFCFYLLWKPEISTTGQSELSHWYWSLNRDRYKVPGTRSTSVNSSLSLSATQRKKVKDAVATTSWRRLLKQAASLLCEPKGKLAWHGPLLLNHSATRGGELPQCTFNSHLLPQHNDSL